MPSSHSATVTALAVAVGLQEGFASSLFATAAVFASVVGSPPCSPSANFCCNQSSLSLSPSINHYPPPTTYAPSQDGATPLGARAAVHARTRRCAAISLLLSTNAIASRSPSVAYPPTREETDMDQPEQSPSSATVALLISLPALENKDREVERLKDVVLFLHVEPEPEPNRRLRDDISTLTDQIQCLTQELAQEAEMHSARSCFDEDGYRSSPRTSGFNEDIAFSLECNIGEAETPNYGSPDEMFSKDLNPCLTNYFGE
uniref:Acid phosphatase/vanadium-dependent haloperoxidase-related protein n=1 Tax=Zea mays TaxID=4577 RepID=A0A804QX14_MAIZE